MGTRSGAGEEKGADTEGTDGGTKEGILLFTGETGHFFLSLVCLFFAFLVFVF